MNAKLTDTQLRKLKTTVKNKTGTALRMSLKIFDGNDLPHELLLTTRQKTKLRNAFNNNMSTDLKLSKAQISKIIQSGGFLGSLLSKLAGPLMKVAVPLAKNILAPLGIRTAASAIDTGIQKKIHDSETTTLIISNEEVHDIMKIVQALEHSNILLKGVTKTIKNEAKEQKRRIFKPVIRYFRSKFVRKHVSRKMNCKSWLWKRMGFLMPPHPLTNFEIQKYYKNEPRFNGVFSRNNLPKKIKDGAYVINLDEYADVGTHWIALFCKKTEIVYFNSFSVEHAPEEIKGFIGNKDMKANIFRIQLSNSIMCGYFCIGFIDFMLAGKKLTDFTSLFSPHNFQKNDCIILSYFKNG